MNRSEKEHVVTSLKSQFSASEASFVIQYKGLTVAQLQELRKKLRAQGGTMQVAKARLIKRAVADLPVQELSSHCREQVALVFSKTEAAPVAKTLAEFAKEHKALSIVSGFAERKILDNKTINFLATLPSREVLLAQLCGVLKGPMAALARVLNAVHESKSAPQSEV
jgi:large subunit ribosomal protein L10